MKKLLKVFNSLEEIIAGSLFGVMCITILCQMFSRIFLKKALLFSEEISRFCYIWVVFLCISLGEKKFEHFNVEVFLSFVQGSTKPAPPGTYKSVLLWNSPLPAVLVCSVL